MEVRNAHYNTFKTIDCEINHPEAGWIPFTASPKDPEVYGREIYAALLNSGNVTTYVAPTQEELDIIAQRKLEQVKQIKKQELIRRKMGLLLGDEFAEIDAALDINEINEVKL